MTVGIDERDEEAARLGRARREGEAEQAALAAAADRPAQIEERRREERATLDHANRSALLDDELHAGVRGILNERDRVRQTRDVDLTAKLRRTGRRDEQEQGECGYRTRERTITSACVLDRRLRHSIHLSVDVDASCRLSRCMMVEPADGC